MAKKLILNRVKELRISKDISTKELAILSGLSQSAINQIENGKRTPSHTTMLKICKGFDMMLEEIFENNYKNVNSV
jgi:DNA-binding XRE family transcriptional regulator